MLWSVSVAWSTLVTQQNLGCNHTLNYAFSETLCTELQSQFWETRLLTLDPIDCTFVATSIRAAFDIWHHNVPSLTFIETPTTSASLVISTLDGGYDNSRTLASAHGVWQCDQHRPVYLQIHLDDDRCWYTDREFCHWVEAHTRVAYSLAGLVWGVSSVGVVCVCLQPFHAIDPTVRILTWTVFFAGPLLLWGAFLPCAQCFDFVTVMVHEIGHVLGLGHTDSPGQLCGCGSNVTQCTVETLATKQHVMWSSPGRRRNSCPSQNDVDGVRTLYGDPCNLPLQCYTFKSYRGFTRVALAVLYAFIFAWMAMCVRNASRAWSQGVKKRRANGHSSIRTSHHDAFARRARIAASSDHVARPRQ
jgi:hypothetical protein